MVAELILVSADTGAGAARQNAQYIARGLSSLGYKVRDQISVCKNAKQLQQAIASSLQRSHVLVTLGGLGSESGYLTKTIFAQGLGLPLEQNIEAASGIRSFCNRTGEPYSPEDNELARLPRGCAVFPGVQGRIPGCAISSSRQHIIMLPETPSEAVPMFNRFVSPYLGGKATTTVTRTVRTYGVSEKYVRDKLGKLLGSTNPAIIVEKEQSDVLVRVAASADYSQQASALCTPVLQSIVDMLGDAAYGLDVDSLQSALLSKLARKNLDIAVAEAGTDGMFARVLTETAGGQDALRYAADVHEDADKTRELGIKRRKLKKLGGVSEFAAVSMAAAARAKASAGIGVAITASASDNETKKCPAGLVYIAVCDAKSVYVKKLVVGDGDATDDAIIDAALSRALNMARLFVDYLPGGYPGSIALTEALAGQTVTDKDSYEAVSDGKPEKNVSASAAKPKKSGGLRRAVFTIAVLVFICSTGYVGYTMYKSYEAKQIAIALNNMFGESEVDEIPGDFPRDYDMRFAALWSENPDVKAFIQIPDTSVNYPIVQAEDNDFYLRRDFYRNSNQHGVPFLDFRASVEKPSDNLVVYGHNMTDGQIFGELIKYRDLDYYKQHPLITFSTVTGGDSQYKIFSVFLTNAYEAQGHVFDYFNFIDAQNDAQFQSFIDQLNYRSIINTTVDARPGDRLITLSTCEYDFKDARLVVVARRTRPGESENVDAESAVLNPQPLYPDIWYDTFSGYEKPDGISSDWSVSGSAQISERALAAAPMAASATSSLTAEEASLKAAEAFNRAASEASRSAAGEAFRKAEEETSRKATEEETSRKAAEEEASRKAAEEEASRKAVEEEASRKAEEEASRKAEEEASRKAAEEEASRKAAEEASSKAAAEEQSRLEVEAAAAAVQVAAIASYDFSGSLTVTVGGSKITGDAYDIVSRVVQNEVGSGFNTEAIKAQAVASYTFIAQSNAGGSSPSVYMAGSASDKVKNAVSAVIGEAVYYKGQLAFTPYHATSAGATTTSSSVWGGSYPYLVSVDSSSDESVSGYRYTTSMTRSKVAELISSRAGISASGDPSSWFDILSYNDGGYVGDVSICGKTKSSSGTRLTGRYVRETLFNLRSAFFEVDYDSGSDSFTFTTYGHGHGVGMSQTGANVYAAQGWSYIDILEHYYPGTSVQ